MVKATESQQRRVSASGVRSSRARSAAGQGGSSAARPDTGASATSGARAASVRPRARGPDVGGLQRVGRDGGRGAERPARLRGDPVAARDRNPYRLAAPFRVHERRAQGRTERARGERVRRTAVTAARVHHRPSPSSSPGPVRPAACSSSPPAASRAGRPGSRTASWCSTAGIGSGRVAAVALVAACDRYGLPLVEVPPGTPFTAIAAGGTASCTGPHPETERRRSRLHQPGRIRVRVREEHPGGQQQLAAEQIRVRVRHLRGVHPQQLGVGRPRDQAEHGWRKHTLQGRRLAA